MLLSLRQTEFILLGLSVFSPSQMLTSGDNEIKHNATAFAGKARALL